MWRETGRSLTFFGLDGRAMFLLLLVLYRPRWWTLAVAIVGIIVLVLMEREGYNLPNALRRARILVMGPLKAAVVGRRQGRSDR